MHVPQSTLATVDSVRAARAQLEQARHPCLAEVRMLKQEEYPAQCFKSKS
jgi:hypothetical protein